MKIYFAAPLFNANERLFNHGVTMSLEQFSTVFLPQRDGALLVDLVRTGIDPATAAQQVFDQDCHAMANADCLVAVLDGAHIDEGVAFEIGFSKALGKICVGLQTDVRRSLPTGNNPMIERALDARFENLDALLSWITHQARRFA